MVLLIRDAFGDPKESSSHQRIITPHWHYGGDCENGMIGMNRRCFELRESSTGQLQKKFLYYWDFGSFWIETAIFRIPIGSMYGIYGNIYHQYMVTCYHQYTIHGSYGIYRRYFSGEKKLGFFRQFAQRLPCSEGCRN